MPKPIKIAITGAAGQIGYSLLFRIASGQLFGNNQKVSLHLLELPQAVKAAEGTAMELADCAFPTLETVQCFDEAKKAFDGVDWVLMVGASPRGPGMERSDLIRANGSIFVEQGKALNYADSQVRVVVVGNPCNTNALIALHNCQEIPATHFSAMTALDENRAVALIAEKAKVNVEEISNLVVWGNHSPTMYPDFENGKISGQPIETKIKDRAWLEGAFLEKVQKRGAEIIAARGKSSAASAASACMDHVKRMCQETPKGQWFSAAIPSDGESYQVPKGLVFSFPVRSNGKGQIEVVKNLPISAYCQSKLDITIKELLSERECIKDLLN